MDSGAALALCERPAQLTGLVDLFFLFSSCFPFLLSLFFSFHFFFLFNFALRCCDVFGRREGFRAVRADSKATHLLTPPPFLSSRRMLMRLSRYL